MNIFFEEDGSFKAGTVLSQAGNAYQVQLPTGRRTKIKASHSFFEFEQRQVQQFEALELTRRELLFLP